MRLKTLFIAALAAAPAAAQTTVTTNPGNTHQTYYSLANGTVGSVALADWDLAFELTGITGSILLNTAKGHRLYKAPYAIDQWASIDTAGLAASWPEQHNSETDWSSGAFNQGLTADPFDLGWGIYNFVTHNIPGDSCFVLKLSTGEWKKMRIDGFTATTNSFNFTWADLDGSNERSGSLTRSNYPGKYFGYYNLDSGTALDLEPAASQWDLVFTKYVGYVTDPFPAMYPVVGVLQHRQVQVAQVDGVPTGDAIFWGQAFEPDINVIGYDWKAFDQGTMAWQYAQDRTYFVKDRTGDIWKLVFTGYGGSATGDITFNQQLVGEAFVDEASRSHALALAPNPAASTVDLIIAADAPAAQVSVVGLDGRVVAEQAIAGLHGLTRHPIDVSALPQGMYLVRVQGAGIDATARLVKE